jgi:phosphate transport system substrate-binding protein
MRAGTTLLAALWLAFSGAGSAVADVVQINGAGATFSAPLYQRWFQDYNKRHPEVQVNYQAIGSAAGIKQFTHGTIDFGASDAAMTDEQIARVHNGAVLLPMTAGEIVLPYNLPGVPQLRLSRNAYIGIFLGSIQNWNDAAIRSSNPGVTLPDLPITVVYRYDGSGTTFVFTQHLCAISPHFKQRVIEEGTQVTWPVGIGGKGNEGVTSLIKQTQGAIGYVEYGYALENRLTMAALQNRSGTYVKPSLDSGALTLSRIELPSDLRGWAIDPTGTDDYPITTFTWLLLYKSYADPAKVAALKNVLLYGLTEGQKCAPELGYIPLPPSVTEKVKAAVETIR